MRMAGMRPEMGPWSRVTVPWIASTATTRPSPSKRDWACPGTAARHRWPQRVVKSSHRRQGCSRDLSIGNHLPSLSPNAGGEPRPRAGARYERRLLGVGSTAWLGRILSSRRGLLSHYQVIGDIEARVEVEEWIPFGSGKVERAAITKRVRSLGQGSEHQEVGVADRRACSTRVTEDPRSRCRECKLRRLDAVGR